MEKDQIKKVLIIGAGTMGAQICLDCLLAGYRVTVYDISKKALDGLTDSFEYYAFNYPGKKPLDRDRVAKAVRNLSVADDAAGAAENADLLIEAVFEDLDLKRKVFAQFEKLCPDRTILTSNTSQLLPSQIEIDIVKKSRFCVYHFNWPRSIVDIMRGTQTSDETVAVLKEFAYKTENLPIITQKEIAGSIHGFLYSQWITSALALVAGGYGSIEDIDRSWMRGEGGVFGPLASLDLVGLDTVQKILENVAALGPGPWDDFLTFIKSYTEKGYLGVKTGRGFYSYPDPEWSKPEFLDFH